MDTELVVYLDRRFDELGGALGTAIRTGDEETRRVLRQEIRTGDEESRRHMGVLAESLVSQIQLVAEGVVALSERVDRLETTFKDEFAKIDRRLLHLTTRLTARRRGR